MLIFIVLLILFGTCYGNKLTSIQNYIKSISIKKTINVFSLMTTASIVRAANDDSNAIRLKYPYIKPSDILPYIHDNSKQGDFYSVTAAMDDFSKVYPMYKLSPLKASLLVQTLKESMPQSILEIGSFLGYSALHFLQYMPNTATLTLIEGNQENIDVLKKIIEYTFGTSIINRYRVVSGISSNVLNSTAALDQLLWSNKSGFDFVFLDHEKSYYLKDTLLLQSKGLLSSNKCKILADNVIYPGAPDYLEYMTTSTKWKTTIKYMPFERQGFETQFKEKEDGMSISFY